MNPVSYVSIWDHANQERHTSKCTEVNGFEFFLPREVYTVQMPQRHHTPLSTWKNDALAVFCHSDPRAAPVEWGGFTRNGDFPKSLGDSGHFLTWQECPWHWMRPPGRPRGHVRPASLWVSEPHPRGPRRGLPCGGLEGVGFLSSSGGHGNPASFLKTRIWVYVGGGPPLEVWVLLGGSQNGGSLSIPSLTFTATWAEGLRRNIQIVKKVCDFQSLASHFFFKWVTACPAFHSHCPGHTSFPREDHPCSCFKDDESVPVREAPIGWSLGAGIKDLRYISRTEFHCGLWSSCTSAWDQHGDFWPGIWDGTIGCVLILPGVQAGACCSWRAPLILSEARGGAGGGEGF